jgi:3D (Asp-Asp-Asp) domain-containing protein
MSYTKDPVYGNHLGIVINKEDPEYRGRVQVWIPHMSNTLHTDWNAELKDKKFKHIHDSGALTPALIEELKKVLPWAECASPIMGGGTAAKYNSYTGQTDTYPARTFLGSKTDYGDNLLIPNDGGNNPNTNGLNKEFTNRLNGLYKDLNDSGYYIGITSGARIGSSGAHNAALQNGAIAVDVRVRGNGKYGNININEINPALDKEKNIDSVEFGQLLEKHGLWQPMHPDRGESKNWGSPLYEKWHIEPIETRQLDNNGKIIANTNRGSVLFGSISNTLNKTSSDLEENVLTKRPVDTAEIPGTSINPSKTATDITRGPESFGESGSTQNLVNVKTVPTTGYSIGKSYGGTDETEDSGTGRGVGSFENELRPGVVAVNTNIYPIGTIFKNADTGNVYIAADKHGNSNPNVVDIYYTPSQYKQLKEKGTPNTPVNLAVIGKVDQRDIPRTSDGLKNFLSQYGNVPEGEGAYEFLASAKDGNFINSPMVSPIPNFNPATYPSNLSGAQPSGFVSIPDAGAKVFVFFLGGDIQKPVYFAGLLETESYRKAVQTASDGTDIISGNQYGSKSYLGSEAGGLGMQYNHSQSTETGLPSIENNVRLNNSLGSALNLNSGDGSLTIPNNFSLISGEVHQSSSLYDLTSKLIHQKSEEDTTIQIGFGSKEENKTKFEAYEKLQKIINDVQKKKVEEIKQKSKKGEKVPCPLCSTSHAVDRASSAAKKVKTLLRKIKLPYFSYAVDTLAFLAELIMIPFCSIVPGSALGECGNSDCEKGMIPSPQKPIEEANKNAAKALASKQKEIAKLEQQLGNGGSYTVCATKDIVISAGLPSGDNNDAPCYVETVNNSITVGLKASKDKQTLIPRSADNCKNVVCCPSIQAPGGNIILRGGNAVKIIAGSPGIELLTKGKLTLNCGSLEILTSDGQMTLGSNNHTVIKGKVVTIDADDRSGEGGVEIKAPHMSCKGLSVSGDAGIKGGLRIDGELSVAYVNGVAQRMSTDDAMPPDQSGKFSNWAVGSAQTNDIANSIRLAITHYGMKDAMLLLSNIIKYVQELYNTILVNTVVETNTTGFGVGYGYVQMYNWHHNHMKEPDPHNHDYIIQRGTLADSKDAVYSAAVEPNPVPTRARQKGMGPDGGPKSLAGCGGFGGWGGGSYKGRRSKYNKLNSFGLYDKVKGFSGTKLQDNNVTYKYNKDGSIEFNIDEKPCD